ncbi:MAG: S-layer homology domain-containing protein [Oscillospiraceae bacterium]|nr:S-layer homology domain-containing protein [Oscillospiraceae bacterium]
MKKRILSLVLALVMCISLLPAVVLVSGAERESIVVNLAYRTSGDPSIAINHDKASIKPAAITGTNFTTVTAETSTAGPASNQIRNNALAVAGYDGVTMLQVVLDATVWNKKAYVNQTTANTAGRWTIEIDAGTTEAGWYDLTIRGTDHFLGGVWEVWADRAYVGDYNCRSEKNVGAGEHLVVNLGKVYISPDANGKFMLSFVLKEQGYTSATDKTPCTTEARILLEDITFAPCDAPSAAERETIVAETSWDTAWYTDKSAPSSAWQTYGFEMVPEKCASYNSRYTAVTLDSQKFYLQWCVRYTFPQYTNQKMTFKVKVPQAGYYRPEMSAIQTKNASLCAIYVNDEYVGDVDFHTAQSGFVKSDFKPLNTVYIPAGEAEISIRPRVRYVANGFGFFIPDTTKLVPVDEPAVSAIESAIPDTLEPGASENMTAKVKMNDSTYRAFGYRTDGSEPSSTNNTVKVTSSDSSVLEVSAVTVVDALDQSLLGTASTAETVTYILTAKEEGEAEITVTAIVDGKTKELKKTVRVGSEDEGEWIAEPVTVDFGNMKRGEGDDGVYGAAWNCNGMFGENFTTVASETASFANKGTRIDLTVANEENVQEKFLIADIGRKPWDGTAGSKVGKWTIEVDLGENARSGYYAVSLRGTKMASGATFAVYVDGVYAGEYSSTLLNDKTSWIFGGKKDLNTVYITPDSNKKVHITFAVTQNGYYAVGGIADTSSPYETARLCLNTLTLTPQPELIELSHKSNVHNLPSEAVAGDKIAFTANAVMSNDEVFRTGKYAVTGGEATTDKFTVTAKTGNVKIEGVVNDGIFEGELTAISGGEAVVELCATIRGTEYKTEHTINIAETVWTGEPVIVDFGTTIRGEGDDGSYAQQWNLRTLHGSGFVTVPSETVSYSSKGTRTDLDVKNEKGEMESILIADCGTKAWSGASDDLKGKWTIEVDLGKGAPSGYYGISIRGTKNADGGIFSVYADGVYAGDYSSTLFEDSNTWVFGGEERLNTVYLTPDSNGKIKITFAVTEKGYYRTGTSTDLTKPYDIARLILNSLKITYLSEVSSVEYKSIGHTLPETMYVRETIDFTANAVMSDDSAYYIGKYKATGGENTDDGFTISAKDSEACEVSGEVKLGKFNGKIKPLKEGPITVVLTAKVSGTEYTSEYTLNAVESPKPEYTMIELSQDTMKYADQTAPSADWETKGFELVLDSGKMTTYNCRYTPLKINLQDGSEKLLVQIQTGTKPWPTRANSMFTIKTDIKASGYYNVKFTGARLANYSDSYIYVNGRYAGNFIFNDPKADFAAGTMYLATEQLNTMYLERGSVEISIRPYEMPSWCAFFVPYSVELVPTDVETVDVSEIQTEIPSVIAVGEKLEALVTVKMSDGTVHFFGPANNGTAIDGENTVNISDASGKVTATNSTRKAEKGTSVLDITGKAEGETTLVVEAVIDGKKTTKEVSIRVEDDPIASTTAAPATEEVMKGDVVALIPTVTLTSGRVTESTAAVTTYKSLTPDIATVSGDKLTALEAGIAQIEVTTVFNGVTKTAIVDIEIVDEGMVSFTATAGGSVRIRLTDKENDTVPLFVQAYSNLGKELDMTGAEISITALAPEYATISESGELNPIAEGDARFSVTVTLNGRTRSGEITLPVVLGKLEGSYYTSERVANVRENVEKYDWARQQANNYKKNADKYVDNLDLIYDLIPSEGIPRGAYMGLMEDPYGTYCRYCNVDLMEKYGQFTWLTNPLQDPWKIQCPDCKRKFPSNDFGSFYKLGLNEYGEFDRQRALDKHAEMFGDPTAEKGSKAYYGYGKGYLENKLYPEVGDRDENGELKIKTINCGQGLRPGETVETWGVDDGYGYYPTDEEGNPFKAPNGIAERHTYIAYYTHFGLWYQLTDYDQNGAILPKAVTNCANAYLHTGEIKYGRAAAILLDRIADFYPDYDTSLWKDIVTNSDGGIYTGKTVGCIWECGEVTTRIECYDMVFDVYEDPFVIKYLSEKSKQIKMRHSKESASQIRTNIEDGLIRTALEGLRDCSVSGNFGMPQAANAMGAVVLDSMPETKEWLEYLMAPGWIRSATSECRGGGIDEVLVNTIDGDGMGNEASSYNNTWLGNLVKVQRVLAVYERYQEANLLNHPKFVQMLYSLYPLMMDYYTPQIGDSGSTAGSGHWAGVTGIRDGWEAFADPIFAQVYYDRYGYEGVTYPITFKNPESLETEIRDVIEEYGTLDLDSEMMTHFGLGMLRAGKNYKLVTDATQTNTFRNTWMYFGSNSGHGHNDTLNLGMTAFGLNYMPDLGYPTLTGTDPERLQWTGTVLSHNTVMVNEKNQINNEEIRGKAKHFSDDGMVQLMDVSTPYVYEETDEYRRSLVTVDIDDSVSYTVDFFRVLGGDDHLYSLHAQSNEISGTAGLELVSQTDESGNYVGSYAGADVPYGKDPNSPAAWDYETVYPRGYTWLNNVDRDSNPSGKFEVDFAIKDFNKMIKDSNGLGLHMTMFNGRNLENGATCEVAIADGYPPQKAENKNIDRLKYVLVKNSGENLDTLFTTVFEPYRTTRALTSSEELTMEITDGAEGDKDASAVLKITHTSGRVDYIFYATNNKVTYKVTDGDLELAFRGFVGVYTVNEDGNNTYTYVHDGDIIGDMTDCKGAIEGVVKSFTTELVLENEIVITPTEPVSDADLAELSGRYLFVDNGPETRSGSYKIIGAERRGDDVAIDVGRVTSIRKYKNVNEPELGYVYIIGEGMPARIPLTSIEDGSPEFVSESKGLTTSVGSVMSYTIVAANEDGESMTYELISGPRGASIEKETGKLTWKAQNSQIGENLFIVSATDESGRKSSMDFVVKVYGSTTGGGGGAATTTPTEPTKPEVETPDVPTTPDVPETTPRFVDLGNHAWAADAINALAEEGIIKGTSETTFSPGNNITRADFAILLVRAFELESDDTENFADVDASDYFARELAVARNTGIVNGIGDNKYAPKNTITRQDMMVIVYRAMQKLDVEFEIADVEYADFRYVADYAKEAVSALITAGLVNGKNGKIAPTDYTTRAEVAVLIKRILDYKK